jgi:transposase, IS6 family
VKSLRPTHPYVKVKGRWSYLYRAVDSRGQTIDFLLSAKRDAEAAKRFFRKALGQPHTVNPRTITVDKNPAYPKAVAEMKENAELWRFSVSARPRTCGGMAGKCRCFGSLETPSVVPEGGVHG